MKGRRMRISPSNLVSLALAGAALLVQGGSATACDEFASRLIANQIRPAVGALGCQDLGRAGLDRADHGLEAVCYTSTGPISEIAITAQLGCRTGDAAFIKAQVSERVTVKVQVRAADCAIQGIALTASGEIGKILLRAFDVEGRARSALQEALTKTCTP